VAHRFLEFVGRPISAPSANLFTALSPTTAKDIAPDIAASLAMIIDGGPCEFGIESTVVDCTSSASHILRLGAVAVADIDQVLRTAASPIGDAPPLTHDVERGRQSPGQYPRHYAPKTPLRIVERLPAGALGLTFGTPTNASQVTMPSDPRAYAARLYATLHGLDRLGSDAIYVESPPETAEWAPIWDRLRRASEKG
jgi:L-threonylcarbamoyladenylate synthase